MPRPWTCSQPERAIPSTDVGHQIMDAELGMQIGQNGLQRLIHRWIAADAAACLGGTRVKIRAAVVSEMALVTRPITSRTHRRQPSILARQIRVRRSYRRTRSTRGRRNTGPNTTASAHRVVSVRPAEPVEAGIALARIDRRPLTPPRAATRALLQATQRQIASQHRQHHRSGGACDDRRNVGHAYRRHLHRRNRANLLTGIADARNDVAPNLHASLRRSNDAL